MSDHIDGPRQLGDPSADLTDLFAFTSPENPARTVLAANVFPTCGVDAVFSNAIDHSIVVRRAKVAGLGDSTKFETSDAELRFSFRFDVLERGTDQKPFQRGTCTLPDGQTLRFVVNEEKGSSTSNGAFRVFAGLRSDPFILAWLFRGNAMTPVPNLLEHDNVLCIVVEFDTGRVLTPERGSLFAVIAETRPLPRAGGLIGNPPPRFDWIGRPEQTNMRLDNPGLAGADDLRDLWNQQTPFTIADQVRPLFLERLKDSLANWDMRDGKADWTPPALAANANMFLDDFLLFDVTKPITDTSYLEIEKSTLDGKAYGTGGGRTVNADVIDGLLSWLVNRDREPLRSGITRATKPGTKNFPYFATPNTELQSDYRPHRPQRHSGQGLGAYRRLRCELAPPDCQYQADRKWNRTIACHRNDRRQRRLSSALRRSTISRGSYRYTSISGIPASDYTGRLEVKANGAGSSVEWGAQYLPKGQGDIVVRTIVSTLFKTGLESLKARF